MIGKVCARGRRVQGLLYYLFTEGRAREKQLSSDHEQPRIIAGFDDPTTLQPPVRADGRRDFRRLAGLLTQPLKLAGVGPDDRLVYHLVASAAKDPETGQLRDRLLSDAEWGDVAQEYLQQLGFARRDDETGVRWTRCGTPTTTSTSSRPSPVRPANGSTRTTTTTPSAAPAIPSNAATAS